MNVEQIIHKAAMRLGTEYEETELCMKTCINIIFEELQKGNDISIENIGNFILCIDENDPQLKDKKREIKFLPSEELNNIINRW